MAKKTNQKASGGARSDRTASPDKKTGAETSEANLKQVTNLGDREVKTKGGGPVMPSMEPDPGRNDMQQTSVNG